MFDGSSTEAKIYSSYLNLEFIQNTWPEVMLTPLPVSKQYDAVFYTEYY